MVHSKVASFGDGAVGLRPDLIKMMIHLETIVVLVRPSHRLSSTAYKKVPSVLYVHGDNVVGNPATTGQPRLTFCTNDTNAINATAVVRLWFNYQTLGSRETTTC